MEYVNRIGGTTYNTFGKMGDDGQNKKSIVAGKNDMGGTTANIAQNFSTTKGGTQGGLLNPSTDDLTAGLGEIQNRPNAKAGKTGFKKSAGTSWEKTKTSADTAPNKTSIIGKKVR